MCNMTNPVPSDPLQQLTVDVSAIVAAVEHLTGLRSRWSGQVVISADADAMGRPAYFGAKEWNCDIVIHHVRLNAAGKYSTLVHEAFHSVSTGLNKSDYCALQGYEEGIVEQCVRLLRDTILAASGLAPATDTRTSYSRYITLLEDLRIKTSKPEQEFYIGLLATTLADREATVLQWIQDAEPTKSRLQIEQETDSVRRRLKR